MSTLTGLPTQHLLPIFRTDHTQPRDNVSKGRRQMKRRSMHLVDITQATRVLVAVLLRFVKTCLPDAMFTGSIEVSK